MKFNEAKAFRLFVSLVAFSFLAIAPAQAAPGDLDQAFGIGGKVSFPVSFPNVGTNFGTAQAVAIQADGKCGGNKKTNKGPYAEFGHTFGWSESWSMNQLQTGD